MLSSLIDTAKNEARKHKGKRIFPALHAYKKTFRNKHIQGCEDYRTKALFLRLRSIDRNGEIQERVGVDLGCGEVLMCLQCGIDYRIRRSKRLKAMYQAMKQAKDKLRLSHLVLTVPKSNKYHNLQSLRHIIKASKEIVNKYFPGSGYMLSLHTWSSKQPEKLHLHVHCVIFCINKDGQFIRHHLSDIELFNLKKDWGLLLKMDIPENLRYTNRKKGKWSNEVLPVCFYEHMNDSKKANHVLNYAMRSPIEDFNKYLEKNNLPKELTDDYIEQVYYLKKLGQRVRFCGWLSNSTYKKFLEGLNIEVKTKFEHEGIEYLYEGLSYGVYDCSGEVAITDKHGTFKIIDKGLKTRKFIFIQKE